jgi:hypothetical protein
MQDPVFIWRRQDMSIVTEGKEKHEESIHYLTQGEVACRFRVTQSTVKNWREKGLLKYLRVSGSTRVLYPVDSVEKLENQSLHQEKEVIRPKEIKRERPGISPRQQKEWRI